MANTDAEGTCAASDPGQPCANSSSTVSLHILASADVGPSRNDHITGFPFAIVCNGGYGIRLTRCRASDVSDVSLEFGSFVTWIEEINEWSALSGLFAPATLHYSRNPVHRHKSKQHGVRKHRLQRAAIKLVRSTCGLSSPSRARCRRWMNPPLLSRGATTG